MAKDIGDIAADYSPSPIHRATEAAASEGIPHALLPATTSAYTAFQAMDAPITPHAVITTGTVTPHPALTISPTSTTHTTPWTNTDVVKCLQPNTPI